MIKNLLLSALLLICCVSAGAQQITFSDTKTPATVLKNIKKAPDNALKWGYTLGDNFSALGTNAAGTFGVAIKVPGTGELKGGKVVSVNLPVYYTGMKNVSVWGAKSLEKPIKVFEKAVTGELEAGYNEITLDEPYEIDGDFFVGYTFTITSVTDSKAGHPIGKVDGDAPGSLYINQNGSFVDYTGGGYGMSALQIFITDVHQDDYNATFRLNKGIFTVANSENVVPVEVVSNGKQDISNIEYSVEINGKTETKTADVAIPAGFRKSGKVNVAFTSPAAIEPYNIKLTINKINGQENSNKTPLYIYGDNVTRKAPYKALVEEYTGTNCGWCPRGWVGMEAIKKELSDISVPIAVHQYNLTDPMLIDEMLYAALPVEGAPSAVINRDSGIDPYYGTYDDVDFGILQDVRDLASTVSPVDINVKAIYNEEQTKVETTAEVEFLSNSGTYSIEYVLTADALKGTSSAWRQRNYYYSHQTSDYDIDPSSELVDFCIGGKYGKEFVSITFNDVAIASSYENYLNTATEMPIDFVAGEKFTDTFSLKMPTKAALKSAIKKDQVYANVMVFDENGYCVNAARVRVLTQEEAAGIKTVQNADSRTQNAYNLAGQRVNANSVRGIYIQNGKKYVK